MLIAGNCRDDGVACQGREVGDEALEKAVDRDAGGGADDLCALAT